MFFFGQGLVRIRAQGKNEPFRRTCRPFHESLHRQSSRPPTGLELEQEVQQDYLLDTTFSGYGPCASRLLACTYMAYHKVTSSGSQKIAYCTPYYIRWGRGHPEPKLIYVLRATIHTQTENRLYIEVYIDYKRGQIPQRHTGNKKQRMVGACTT